LNTYHYKNLCVVRLDQFTQKIGKMVGKGANLIIFMKRIEVKKRFYFSVHFIDRLTIQSRICVSKPKSNLKTETKVRFIFVRPNIKKSFREGLKMRKKETSFLLILTFHECHTVSIA
jgi:hypothetical protein